MSEAGDGALRQLRAGRRGDGRISSSRGLSLFELVIVITIIAVLAAVALDRLEGLRAEAERATMEQVLGILRSSVGMRFAQYYAEGNMEAIRKLVGTNPMDQLAETPGNYQGVLTDDQAREVRPGSWYFDAAQGYLVYRGKDARALAGADQARFVLRLLYEDKNHNAVFDPGQDKPQGLRLEPVK